MAPISVKMIDASPTWIGFYRCFFAAVALLPWTFYRVYQSRRKSSFVFRDRKLLVFLGMAGFVLALDLLVWHRAIVYAGAGIGTILANTQVFYSALFGVVFYRNRLSWRLVLSIALAFVGLLLLLRVGDSSHHGGPRFYDGIMFGVLTGIAYAGFVLTLRKAETGWPQVGAGEKIFFVSLVAASFMFLFGTMESPMPSLRGSSLTWAVILALGPQVTGWILISQNIPKVSVVLVGLILMVQPVLATILGKMLFQETMSVLQLVGAAITLTAVYVGQLR